LAEVSAKALDEKVEPSLDLALRLITEADFSDQRRIRDLILEMKNAADSSLAPSGHMYAATRAGKYYSRARAVEEIWNGLNQLEWIHTIMALDIEEISRTLIRIRDTLASHAGLMVNLTGSGDTLTASLRSIGQRFGRFGPPRSRNPNSVEAEPFFALLGNKVDVSAKHEVYASPSLQVGFAAMAMEGADFRRPEQVGEIILAHELSTGALWEDIRMKGGAYGAFAYPDSLERVFTLSSYRDPNPLRSLDAFSSVLETAARQKGDEDVLEKAIIGTYAKEIRPRTSDEKGTTDFRRFLYGIEDSYRLQRLKGMIGVSADAITNVAQDLASRCGEASTVILAGPGIAAKAADKLGVAVKELPV
jgi:Zn-dependent M16 (insulinase) family peptidase